ncbi:unnamed protein product, partial [Laminaria digitata]
MTASDDGDEHQIFEKVKNVLNQINKHDGPYSALQLGVLKTLDQILEVTDDDNADKIEVKLALQEHALVALPENTAEVLTRSKGGSGLAVELVRRDLTELSVLARALYASTQATRATDEGLDRLYKTLSPIVELHGALVTAGVDVEEREWARSLTCQVPNLRRLRSTPWHEVALVLKLIMAEVTEAGDNDGTAQGNEAFDGTQPWANPPTRAEIRIIQELYAFGEGAPIIRRQVLSVRLGLDVADQLEEMGIFDASAMTPEDTRKLTDLATVQLKQEQEEAASAAQQQSAEEDAPASVGSTPRALPGLVAIAAKLAPTVLKVLPKLSALTKLTNLGGKAGISIMSNKLNAMSSNAGSGTSTGTTATASEGGAKEEEKEEKTSGALSGLVTTIKQVKEIKELLTIDVEAGVAAIELEKARLQANMDYVRQELERVSVAGKTQEEIATAQIALDKAKAAVAASEGWQNHIASDATQTLQSSLQSQRLSLGETSTSTTSSYSSNEELVAKASGGAALYGMNFFPTTTDIVLKPYAPLLATPSFVEMTGAVANFEANVWQTTSVSKASNFLKISENAGSSMAERIATSEGGSGSASFFFASASGSSGKTDLSEKTDAEVKEFERVRSTKNSASTATAIEYIKCPMKSFRIPMTRMQLSEDAYSAAVEVDSIRDADMFLDAYGSHVSNGRQELGGIFYSTITITSVELVNSDSIMAAASKTSSELKEASSNKEVGGSVGLFGFGGKASSVFGKASSTGTTKINTRAESSGSDNRELEARYQQYIRCTGPRAPTPESFADALFNDNSSWAVTDRGPIEALVSITRVLENTIEFMEDSNPDKDSLETSVNYITAAWRIRAKRWGDVLFDETNQTKNDDIPDAVLDLLRTAYPTAQGVVQELIDAVYNALQFEASPADTAFWGDPAHDSRRPSSEAAAQAVAAAIRAAVHVVTGGNSAPSLLSYLDADDVGAYVVKVMTEKEDANKAGFFVEFQGAFSDAELESMWAKLRPFVRFGKFDPAAPADDQSDRTYFESLAPWEQRWIEKDDQFAQTEKTWDSADWEVFQREYFKADEASTFLPELARQLESSFFLNTTTTVDNRDQGVVVRVVPATTVKNLALREAVTEAARVMEPEDWIIFGKIWTAEANPEETN